MNCVKILTSHLPTLQFTGTVANVVFFWPEVALHLNLIGYYYKL
jgi:hypothetical protein